MNLLFIGPIFFGYEKIISKELQKKASHVTFQCEMPLNNSGFYYFLRRISPLLSKKLIESYNKKLVNVLIENKIDVVLLIRGFGINTHFLEAAKSRGVKIINYQWDSFDNNPNALVISQYTDLNYSFDLRDVRSNSKYKHLPLFYDWSTIDSTSHSQTAPLYDVFFVGTYHSQRLELVEKIREQCELEGLVMHAHIFHPFGSYVRKWINGERIPLSKITFKSLTRQQYFALLSCSRSVFDVQNQLQSGATMRTIETLSLNKKLISTNFHLREESFYDSTSIYLWNLESQFSIRTFLDTINQQKDSQKVLSVSQWLDMLLSSLNTDN